MIMMQAEEEEEEEDEMGRVREGERGKSYDDDEGIPRTNARAHAVTEEHVQNAKLRRPRLLRGRPSG